jgi:hypothetical protein
MFGKKKREEQLAGLSGDSAAGSGYELDPELQELMDLEEAERRAQSGSLPAPGAPRAPERQEIMDLEEAERRAASGGVPVAGGPLDPELQELMDLEEAERRASASGAGLSRLDLLQQLGELHAQGILSDAEFEQEKARILQEP